MDPDNVVRSCNAGNLWIEDHPTLARELGLVVREGDPDWTRLRGVGHVGNLTRKVDGEWYMRPLADADG